MNFLAHIAGRLCTARNLAALLVCTAPLQLALAANDPMALDDLSLEELTSLKVTTSARHVQNAADAAAALFVLTQDDIRRSGATSLPQALRLVPGLQVAQVDSSRWAITVRGFNSRMSNRVLVLIDGRSLYSPLSGGILWDAQDTMIEEVERIEVVRGPGGAVWGANAFNGVINIITKHTAQTGGLVLSSELGDDNNAMAALRYGDAEGAVEWRVFAKYLDAARNEDAHDYSANDSWAQSRVGARTDVALNERDELRLNFEAYSGRAGFTPYDPRALIDTLGPAPDDLGAIPGVEMIEGGFSGAQFTRKFGGDSVLSVDASVQYYNRDSPLLDSFGDVEELNLQYVAPQLGAHRLTAGLNARNATENVSADAIWRLSQREVHRRKYGGFLQDEIGFLDERLLFTLGAKIEHSPEEGAHLMPNVRARYAFENGPTVWTAVSRGFRTPSLIENYGRFAGKGIRAGSPINPFPVPLYMDMWGDPQMHSERVTAYEIGFRQAFTSKLSVDLALFRNHYEGLRGIGAVLPPTCEPQGVPVASQPECLFTATSVTMPGVLTNVYAEDAVGGELVVSFYPLPNWRLLGSYTYLEHRLANATRQFGSLQSDPRAFGGGYDPSEQASLRSSLRLGAGWELDAHLRYISELPDAGIPAYTELNLRAAWRASTQLELALAGYNLLHDRHQEFESDFYDLRPVYIERSVLLQARWVY